MNLVILYPTYNDDLVLYLMSYSGTLIQPQNQVSGVYSGFYPRYMIISNVLRDIFE
jgi:hypothetical protein